MHDNVTRLLGMAVRRRRNSLNLSQEELAHRSRLNRTYITDIERGARNPSLRKVLETMLHHVIAGSPAGACGKPACSPASSDDMLDAAVLAELRQLNDDGEALAALIRRFIDSIPERLALLRQAYGASDDDGLRRLAHDLVGTAGNLGLRAIHRVARDIESHGKHRTLDHVPPLIDALSRVFDEVRPRLLNELGTSAA